MSEDFARLAQLLASGADAPVPTSEAEATRAWHHAMTTTYKASYQLHRLQHRVVREDGDTVLYAGEHRVGSVRLSNEEIDRLLLGLRNRLTPEERRVMYTPVEMTEGQGGYGAKWGVTDLYEGPRARLQAALASGMDFETTTWGAHKEIQWGRCAATGTR